ncbi:MAG TPA: hypothetical protein VH414_00305 [Lichenihabitans sp.]|jgi:plasmid stability protein|nr:hypothetical protein [Lichenihabitans sp.]
MAGSLYLHDIDDDVMDRLEHRAERNGRPIEAELHDILRLALSVEPVRSFDELAAELRALTIQRKQTPSEVLLVEGRAER